MLHQIAISPEPSMDEIKSTDFELSKTTLKKIAVNNALKDAQNERRNVLRSCCFELDARFLKFLVQAIISLLIIIFSLTTLINSNTSCEASSVYVSLLSVVLGI